jgi:hypothetical protein
MMFDVAGLAVFGLALGHGASLMRWGYSALMLNQKWLVFHM